MWRRGIDMGRKRPFLVAIGFTSLILLSVYRYFEYRSQLADDFQQFQLNREEKILAYSRIGKNLILEQKYTDLKILLDIARKARDIDFYIVQYKGSPILLQAYGDHPEAVDIDYKIKDHLLRGPRASAYSTAVDPDTTLTIGINRSFDDHFSFTLSKERASELQIVIGPIILFLMVVAYFFRDIRLLIDQIRSRRRRSFKNIETKSAEAEVLVSTINSFTLEEQRLVKEKQVLEGQVLPSLRTELSSGQKPPYSFGCTLVRTDINNFSHLFNNFNSEQLMDVINSFFTDISHIVSRYQGLVHEFVGDEIIYYFKDQPDLESNLLALGALREIDQLTKEYSLRTLEHQGYPWSVKSSLAHGTLRFGHLVNGFTLAGSVLIETVRILSHVQDKHENVVCASREIADRSTQTAHWEPLIEVQLKGYSTKVEIDRIREFKPMAKDMNINSVSLLENLNYFRNDHDICLILKALTSHWLKWGERQSLQVIRSLRTIPRSDSGSWGSTDKSSEIAADLLKMLMVLRDIKTDIHNSTYLFSASCMLAINLLSNKEYKQSFHSEFQSWIDTPQPRAVANILQVMRHFRATLPYETVRSLLGHPHHRLATNAIIYLGILGITEEVLVVLTERMNSKEEATVVSGLYAFGEIAEYYRNSDHIYFNGHIEFHKLTEKVRALANSELAKVKEHAKLALGKYGVAPEQQSA